MREEEVDAEGPGRTFTGTGWILFGGGLTAAGMGGILSATPLPVALGGIVAGIGVLGCLIGCCTLFAANLFRDTDDWFGNRPS